jgi:hypothetical protein
MIQPSNHLISIILIKASHDTCIRRFPEVQLHNHCLLFSVLDCLHVVVGDVHLILTTQIGPHPQSFYLTLEALQQYLGNLLNGTIRNKIGL